MNDDLIYSKVMIKKMVEHKDMFGIPDSKAELQLMSVSEYRDMSRRDAFFYVDHNSFLRHQFSGEVLAASKEQLDILIEQLNSKRELMGSAMDCTRE